MVRLALVPGAYPKKLSTRDYFFQYTCGHKMTSKEKLALWKSKSNDEKNRVKKECKVFNDAQEFPSHG